MGTVYLYYQEKLYSGILAFHFILWRASVEWLIGDFVKLLHYICKNVRLTWYYSVVKCLTIAVCKYMFCCKVKLYLGMKGDLLFSETSVKWPFQELQDLLSFDLRMWGAAII